MSQQTKKEYINCQRERYLKVRTRRERTEIIDEICRFTGLNRKYVIKLLNKNIVYRERRPRSPTYSELSKKSSVSFLFDEIRVSPCAPQTLCPANASQRFSFNARNKKMISLLLSKW